MKKFKEWLNEDANFSKTSIDNPGAFTYNPIAEEEESNYMFFSNLKRIKEVSTMILAMDRKKIDEMLNNGHDWANDHVTVAKEDLTQVFEFFKGSITKPVTESSSTDNLKRQYSMSPTWWVAWRLENEKPKGYTITKDAFSKTYEVKKDDETLFVFDYQRNKVFTNESPSMFVIQNDISAEEMKNIQNKADKIKGDSPKEEPKEKPEDSNIESDEKKSEEE